MKRQINAMPFPACGRGRRSSDVPRNDGEIEKTLHSLRVLIGEDQSLLRRGAPPGVARQVIPKPKCIALALEVEALLQSATPQPALGAPAALIPVLQRCVLRSALRRLNAFQRGAQQVRRGLSGPATSPAEAGSATVRAAAQGPRG